MGLTGADGPTGATGATGGGGAGNIVLQSRTLDIVALNAAGAGNVHTFDIGAALPTNARLLSTEVDLVTNFAAIGITQANVEVGDNVLSTNNLLQNIDAVATPAPFLFGYGLGFNGANQFPSRGGRIIQATITLDAGINFSDLTSGELTVNLFYAVVV
jgi:hypothetical protein